MARTAKGNLTNIYRVRSGWYLQLQWARGTYRELFGTAEYGGRRAALITAIAARDWLNRFRAEHVAAVGLMIAANESGDTRSYNAAMATLTRSVRAGCRASSKLDREMFAKYFSQEPSYVALA